MKVKAGIVYNALDVINEISEKPMKVSLIAKLLRLSDELEKENRLIEKQRKEILQKYGKKDENGELIIDENGNISFDQANLNEVNQEFNSLLGTELEINADKLPMDSMDNFEITPQEMLGIEVFFEE